MTTIVAETMDQEEINRQNSMFWNTLCGTGLAISLGITDGSPESLKKFDDWYFDMYPYLIDYIPFGAVNGRRVLEVGLGYGSVSQRLSQAGAEYVGIDIANNPVAMANERMHHINGNGRAQRGSILAAPFADESFDYIVAIGCYHHTGDLQRALDESHRMLRAGGVLVAMVYNGYSYRRWWNSSLPTVRYFMWDWLGIGTPPLAEATERAAYDTDMAGIAAPHTDFVSRHHLRRMCRRFRSFRAALANIDQEAPFAKRSRRELLATRWPSLCGLDIYFEAHK